MTCAACLPTAAAAAAGAVRPAGGDAKGQAEDGIELDTVKVCGLELLVERRREDYYMAMAGDLPVTATGVVLWECGVLLADYLGYARWQQRAKKEGDAEVPRQWWLVHPPAAVVPSRFWSAPSRGTVLELGGGCGVVAATLASLGAKVLCTDGDPAALSAAARNCSNARRRAPRGLRQQWGQVVFRQFSWGDKEKSRQLALEHGPFSLIVGSDLLYGEASPAAPLLETLAAMAAEPAAWDAEVILAVKSRCADETTAFVEGAQRLGLWDVRLAERDDLPEGYDAQFTLPGFKEGPAYNIIHLVVKKELRSSAAGGTEPPLKRRCHVAAASLAEPCPPSACAPV